MSRAAVAVLLALVAASQALAAPWIAPAGTGWVSARAERFASDTIPGAADGRVLGAVTSVAASGTVGLPQELELSFDLPYSVAVNEFGDQSRYANHSLSDARVMLSRRLLPAVPSALTLEAKVPMYRRVQDQGFGGLVTVDGELWPTNRFPEVGDGNLDLMLGASVGHSFHPAPSWVTARAGYRLRLGPWVDAVEAAVDCGGWLSQDRVGAGLFVFGTVNLGEDENPLLYRSKQFLQVAGYLLIGVPFTRSLLVKVFAGVIPFAGNADTGQSYGAALVQSF